MFGRSAVLAALCFQGIAIRRKKSRGCDATNEILGAAQKFVNGKVSSLLDEKKEIALDLFTVGHEIKLFGCAIALEMTSSLNVTGLDSLGIQNLQCANEACLETSEDGSCAKKQYNIDFAFGLRNLTVNGSSDLDLDACRGGLGTQMGLDYKISEPQFMISTLMEETAGFSLRKFKIKKVMGIDWQAGNVTKTYDCGFERLPKAIEKKVESWCETAMEWTAKKVHKKILLKVLNFVKKLTNRGFNEDGVDLTPNEAPASAPVTAIRAPAPSRRAPKPSRWAKFKNRFSRRRSSKRSSKRSRSSRSSSRSSR